MLTDSPRAWCTRKATAPRLALPAGAWDTHAHVFGPFDQYPLAPDSRYQPPMAPREAYYSTLDTAGFAHGVLVHASANGFDNRGTLDAVRQHFPRARAIGVVAESSNDSELLSLDGAGVRGLRFTENGERIGAPKPSGTLGLDALQRMAPRLRHLGWHALVWAKCDYIVESMAWLGEIGVPLVLDHMGAFDVTRGVRDSAFQSLLRLLDTGSVWVKLVTTRVTSLRWNDGSDVRPFYDALLTRAPDRMLWGSDWPYIGMDKHLPDVGAQIDLFDKWTGDGALREKVFVSNPKALYGRA